MQLFKRQKTFSQFFVVFPKVTSNFKHFEKRDDPRSLRISESTYWERLG